MSYIGGEAPGLIPMRLVVRLIEPEEHPIGERQVSLWIQDTVVPHNASVRWTFENKPTKWGIVQRAIVELSAEQFTAIVRAEKAQLWIGATDIRLKRWELIDLEGLFRATICGTSFAKLDRQMQRIEAPSN